MILANLLILVNLVNWVILVIPRRVVILVNLMILKNWIILVNLGIMVIVLNLVILVILRSM